MRAVTRPALRSVLACAEAAEGWAAMLAYGGVAVLLIGDVLAREVFGIAIMGAQSLSVLAAIVAGFLGLSLATAKGAHLRPEVFDRLLPARFDPVIGRGSDLLAAVLFTAFAVFALQFVGESRAAGDRAAVLYFPLWPLQLVMPYAFLSCALRHAAYAFDPGLKPGCGAGS